MRIWIGLIVCLSLSWAAQAAQVCVEELAGVCLRYENRAAPATPKAPRKAQPVSPEVQAERALALRAADRRAIQTALKQQGHYRGAIDGAIGPGTRRAIAGWQGAQGFAATGYLDQTQVTLLKRQAQAPGSQPAPQTAATDPSADPVIGRTYTVRRQGSSGTDIDVFVTPKSNTVATIRVRIENYIGVYDQSCDAPLSGPFRCRLRATREWSERRIEGELPSLILTSQGSASSGIYEFKLW